MSNNSIHDKYWRNWACSWTAFTSQSYKTNPLNTYSYSPKFVDSQSSFSHLWLLFLVTVHVGFHVASHSMSPTYCSPQYLLAYDFQVGHLLELLPHIYDVESLACTGFGNPFSFSFKINCIGRRGENENCTTHWMQDPEEGRLMEGRAFRNIGKNIYIYSRL